jgi:hypothetical protein
VDSLTFKHYNLSDIVAKPRAYIGQTIDQDADLDTIPRCVQILIATMTEFQILLKPQGKGFKSFSGVDTNKDGLIMHFEPD